MTELQQIVALWRTAKAQQEEICLATIVSVEGSSYRKPGARMLLTRSGQRAGTISGGCLEGEVAKKAWWLTESGPTIQRYSSFFDDDSPAPYGLGCGGTVHILLDRGSAAHAVLHALELSLSERVPFVTVTDLNKPAMLLIQQSSTETLFLHDDATSSAIRAMAHRALQEQRSCYTSLHEESAEPDLFIEYTAPPVALAIAGAGDDVKPLADFANRLGWHVTIADGRSHLASIERFPTADHIAVLDYNVPAQLQALVADNNHAIVLLTHSYEQDRALLRALLPRAPKYLGILGPRQRTERLIAEIASQVDMTPHECMARLHAPVGFDIGAHTPESIALSIVTEIYAVLNGRNGASLKNSSRDRKHIHDKLLHV